MAREKKSSGGGPSDERVAKDEKLGPDAPAAAPSVMAKYGGVIVPLVVFGLIALAVVVDMLMN